MKKKYKYCCKHILNLPDRSLTDPIEARDFIWLSGGEGDLRLFPFTRVQFDTFSRFLFTPVLSATAAQTTWSN